MKFSLNSDLPPANYAIYIAKVTDETNACTLQNPSYCVYFPLINGIIIELKLPYNICFVAG